MKVHWELNNFLFGLPFIALWWGWCSLLGPPGMFPTRSSWMIVVTGQVCLCYIPDQMTLPVYLGTSCCVLAILLPTGDSLLTSFCSPGILLPKWQLLTKHHNTIFTYYTYAITLTPCISSQLILCSVHLYTSTRLSTNCPLSAPPTPTPAWTVRTSPHREPRSMTQPHRQRKTR